jgi:hypothetical protein
MDRGLLRFQHRKFGPRPRSFLARVRRFVAVGAVTAPLVVGATSGVATAGTAGAGTAAATPRAGSYTGVNPQNDEPVTFYVSPGETSVQDISVPVVDLTCAPGGATFTEPLGMATIARKSEGPFSGTTTQEGVVAGHPATFTSTFRARFHDLNPSGVPTMTGGFDETVTYTDITARSCTSGTQSWTATRDDQPPPTTTPPPAGSYTAVNPQNDDPVTFYVSSNRKSLQDISIPAVDLTCAPGAATFTESLGLSAVALRSDGSFSATDTQAGVVAGHPATFTDTWEGNFHGVDASGAARAAGIFSETVTYTDSTPRHCTSNDQSWTAARDDQPTQTSGPPPAGSYTAVNPQNDDPVTFYVSSNRKSLQDISIPAVDLTCAPGGVTFTEPLGMSTVAFNSNGWFSASDTQIWVVAGYPATFTDTLEGNFHGVDASGAARVAGIFSETVAYTDGTRRDCTSNDQSWTAARDDQPTQTSGPPPAGSYTAVNPQNDDPVTFSVSPDQTSLENVSVPVVDLTCVPGGATFTEPLGMPTVALAPDGSFLATTTRDGTVAGHPATFTSTFEGNFHGVNASGAARAAGMFTETVAYTDTVARDCTSNDQSWTATLAS